MKLSKRIFICFLAVLLLVPVFGIASASEPTGILVDSASVDSWNSLLAENAKWYEKESAVQSEYWSNIDKFLYTLGIGEFYSYDVICNITAGLDMAGPGLLGTYAEMWEDSFFRLWNTPDYIVMYDTALGVWRPFDNKVQLWVVNSLGHFPYYKPDSGSDDSGDDDTGSDPVVERVGKWVNMQNVGTQTVLWHVASNYELNEYKSQWADLYPDAKIIEAGSYYWLVRSDSYTAYVLCDKYGYPYYLPKDDETAVTTPNNYYTDQGDTYIDDDSTVVNVYDDGAALVGSPIDVNNGIINVGGEVYYIDELTYDASTQTYYVDAHDEYVYNSTTNNYTTNNYSFKFEYYIDYTSVTYIGQTEEYQERYEYYYQLPDGRSSADLTAEDLEQLSVVFKDVLQYARTADNVDLRALYHFDGSVEDSSYWSYVTSFDWAIGSSLTYLDEGTFNGSLYLDETLHCFTVTLPNEVDVYGDFTLQFRYYQSYTAAPDKDSYVFLGDISILSFDGAYYYDRDGTVLSQTSVGCWNEICVMRSGSSLCYYINGVFIRELTDVMLYPNYVEFLFGMFQQTYKKLDELRFTRAAIYVPGEDYTPTSVPFDSNLALILPDGERPVADESLVIVSAENNLLGIPDSDSWADYVLEQTNSITDSLKGYQYSDVVSDGSLFLFNSTYTQLSSSGEVLTLQSSGTDAWSDYDAGSGFMWNGGTKNVLRNGLFLPIVGQETGERFYSDVVSGDGSYVLSVVMSDGTRCSIAFKVNSLVISVLSVTQGSPVNLSVISLAHSNDYVVGDDSFSYYAVLSGVSIVPAAADTAVEIVYIELVQGSEPGYSLTWDTAMYSSGELERSPVLAVRTNTTITGYQIGGVRPSYPVKGLVYAMVENSRIVSLQLYDGSAWIAVDGRIWTGERWIPCASFDVFTLQDFYDLIGASDPEYEYIYSESGFWSWFQKQWLILMEKLDDIIAALDVLSGNFDDLADSLDATVDQFVLVFFSVDSDVSIKTEDITNIGIVVGDVRGFFNTGFEWSDLQAEFNSGDYVSWFTIDIAGSLDTTTNVALSGDDDPYNLHYYYDRLQEFESVRNGSEAVADE